MDKDSLKLEITQMSRIKDIIKLLDDLSIQNLFEIMHLYKKETYDKANSYFNETRDQNHIEKILESMKNSGVEVGHYNLINSVIDKLNKSLSISKEGIKFDLLHMITLKYLDVHIYTNTWGSELGNLTYTQYLHSKFLNIADNQSLEESIKKKIHHEYSDPYMFCNILTEIFLLLSIKNCSMDFCVSISIVGESTYILKTIKENIKSLSKAEEALKIIKADLGEVKDVKQRLEDINKNIMSIMAIVLAAFSIIGFNIYSLNKSISVAGILLMNVSLTYVLSFVFLILEFVVYKNKDSKKMIITTILSAIALVLLLYYYDRNGYLVNNFIQTYN